MQLGVTHWATSVALLQLVIEATHSLSGRIGKVVASHAEGCKIEYRLWLSSTDLYLARGAQRVLPMMMGGATSQLDLPSLTILSVAGCG